MRREEILIILYNLLYLILAPFLVLFVLVKALRNEKYRRGWLEKLAIRLPEVEGDNNLWIHAVSVGETLLIAPIVVRLREILGSRVKIFFSTTTSTGMKVAKDRLSSYVDGFFYFPIDFYPFVLRVMRRIRPRVTIIVETEIWPSILYVAHKEGFKVYMVNGRISDRSFGGYLLFSFFFEPFLNLYERAFVRSSVDKVRLSSIGLRPDKIQVTGNLKYYSTLVQASLVDPTSLRRELDLDFSERVIVFGSTHPGEEEMFLKPISKLVGKGYKVVLAPRHPERVDEVLRLMESEGLKVWLRSKGGFKGDVLIVDTVGELMRFYSISNVAIVGGSFVPVGGHNPLEPLCFGVPVIIGPYYHNFEDIVDYLKEHIVIYRNGVEGLVETIEDLSRREIPVDSLRAKLSAIAKGVDLVIEEIVKNYLED